MPIVKKLDPPGEDLHEGIVIKVEDNLDHRSRKFPNPGFSQRGDFFFNTHSVNSLQLGFKPVPAGCYSGALTTMLEALSPSVI